MFTKIDCWNGSEESVDAYKEQIRDDKGTDYSERYLWRRNVTACLNTLISRIEVVMGKRWKESTTALNLLSTIDGLLNRVDPKTVLAEYLTAISKENLRPNEGTSE